jgi:hypothetical protein
VLGEKLASVLSTLSLWKRRMMKGKLRSNAPKHRNQIRLTEPLTRASNCVTQSTALI